MGKKDKLLKRLLSKPKDFTFDEMESLLGYFGYSVYNKGKTSGSRIMFVSDSHGAVLLHKPHSRKEFLSYQIKQVIDLLLQEGLI